MAWVTIGEGFLFRSAVFALGIYAIVLWPGIMLIPSWEIGNCRKSRLIWAPWEIDAEMLLLTSSWDPIPFYGVKKIFPRRYKKKMCHRTWCSFWNLCPWNACQQRHSTSESEQFISIARQHFFSRRSLNVQTGTAFLILAISNTYTARECCVSAHRAKKAKAAEQ